MKIAVVGGSGGIGQALVRNLARADGVSVIHSTYYKNRPGVFPPNTEWRRLDLTDESSIADWSRNIGEIDWLINAVGVLHTDDGRPEKSLAGLRPEFFMRNIAVNTFPTLQLARFLQDKFNHGREAVFSVVSARIGSIEDNRLGGWYSYRASKAALNMCVKTLSIEWKRKLPNVSVICLHPGTTDTALSAPFQRSVKTDRMCSTDQTATNLIRVLESLTPQDSGQFLSYSGERLPW